MHDMWMYVKARKNFLLAALAAVLVLALMLLLAGRGDPFKYSLF